MEMSGSDAAMPPRKLERAQLLVELGACVREWAQAQARGALAGDPHVARLRTQTAALQPEFGMAGFGGIAVRLTELLARVEQSGRVWGLNESIEALSDLSKQAWESLSPEEKSRLTNPRNFGGWAQMMPSAPDAGPKPPPLIPTGDARSGGFPAPLGDAPPASAKPPPLLNQQPPQQPPVPPLPVFQPSGAGLPDAVRMRSAPPVERHSVAGGSQAPPGAPAVPRLSLNVQSKLALPPVGAAAPAGGRPQDSIAPPPQLGAPVGPLQPQPPHQHLPAPSRSRVPNAPNLQVRTMFGLRAFGAKKPTKGSAPHEPASPGQPHQRGSLLGLKHRASSAFSPPAVPPPLLDRPLAGLPALAPSTGSSPPDNVRPAGLDRGLGRVSRLLMLGDVARSRVDQRGGRSGQPAPILRYHQEEGNGWRLGAIALAVLALVLGGLATLIVVLSRESSEESRVSATSPGSGQATGGALASAPLPESRLLTDDEAFRSLLTQVHGRGSESAELRALVDEEAALLARSRSQRGCSGSSAACQAWAKMQESLLGPDGAKRVVRRRASGSVDRVRSHWLVGLKLPEIPIEDDPRVQRSLEFYTENQVGRATFQEMLFRCGAYRDLIQSTLIRYGLPADLWAIVFVESGCSPQATSPVGAGGLWQFMPATARAYHLRVKEETIDERRSPPKSTEAAARYLRDLRDKLSVYNQSGVWDLVFGSYNMGPFGMIARMERAGGNGIGFWDLVDADLLPDETSQYSPAVQAVALILNNLQRLKFSAVQMRAPQLTSDLQVPAGTRLSLVARAAAMSVNDLRALNLDISGDTTPDVADFAIQVPKDVVWQARDSLRELVANRDSMDQCVPPTFNWGRERFTQAMETACRRKLGTSAPAKGGPRP